jgi:hypothetical protein
MDKLSIPQFQVVAAEPIPGQTANRHAVLYSGTLEWRAREVYSQTTGIVTMIRNGIVVEEG